MKIIAIQNTNYGTHKRYSTREYSISYVNRLQYSWCGRELRRIRYRKRQHPYGLGESNRESGGGGV